MMDLDRFIGIPYVPMGRSDKGLDCWGVVWLYHALVLQNNLPTHPMDPDDLVSFRKQYILDTKIQPKYTKVELNDLKEGDIICFVTKDAKSISHVGVYIGDNKFMQSIEKVGCHIIPMNHPNWKNRMKGFWRHINGRTETAQRGSG
jgi:cell wall-associated NlpC family hydrolase